ncbi:MAG TPA: hypothetical protein VJN18_06625 [Polyangiaceae bacterium]|nr:hypothetical protein [Polyangiaceae bacterium]
MTTPRTDEDHSLRAALWAVALSGAVLTLGAPFVLGKDGVLGVALGSLIAALNLWALARVVRALMNGAGLPWVLLGSAKLFVLLALVAVILKLEIAGLIPLAVGYGALPIGSVFSQLGGGRAAWRQQG